MLPLLIKIFNFRFVKSSEIGYFNRLQNNQGSLTITLLLRLFSRESDISDSGHCHVY